jgi:chemotaxis protein methyltransferase CheR
MEEISGISRILKRVHGIDISCYDDSFLAKSVEKRMVSINCETPPLYEEILTADKNEAIALSNSLNIGYSEFFRNPLSFALLEQMVIPRLLELKSGKSELRVWSAGCASGQESYSIAILLEDLFTRKELPARFRVFGTDVSDRLLTEARRGIFSITDVQNLSMRYAEKYLIRKGDSFTVCDQIRDRIDFSNYNLLDHNSVSPSASIFGDFDLIFCCNIMFYYKPEIRLRILNKIYSSLSPSGFFVTGEAEREIVSSGRFRAIVPPVAVFQKT